MNDVFKALSDPTRREILRLLKNNDLCAGDIWGHFQISKPSITHHLNLLTQAKLVLKEKRGQNIIYSINTTVFQEAVQWLFDFRNTKGEDEDSDVIEDLDSAVKGDGINNEKQ
jgi:DNA-binding transcriptional ArsR family regulator